MEASVLSVERGTLVDVLRNRARETPDRTAFQFLENGKEGARITYEDLDQGARRIAAYFQEKAFAGERVLLLYPQGLSFIIAYFGCLYAGVAGIPAYPPKKNHHMNRLKAIVDDCGAAAVLTTEALAQRHEHTATEQGWKDMPWVASDVVVSEQATVEWQHPEIDPDTLAFLQYTSGSTGQPKGVMVSHGNLIHNTEMFRKAFRLDETTPILSWLPFYHDMGLIGKILTSVYVGAVCYFMSPMDFLQRPKRWLELISKYRIYYSGAPNFAYDSCHRKIKQEDLQTWDLSCWKVALNGAELIRSSTLKHFADRFAACGFREEALNPGYGLAENTLMVSVGEVEKKPVLCRLDAEALKQGRVEEAPPNAEGPTREVVGCGHLYFDQEVTIVDPDSRQTSPENRIGEVWVKGSSNAKGYWNRPNLTEKEFRAYRADKGDGPYLRTGDLGFKRGAETFITGRIKELMVIRGHNYYPQDIEETVENGYPEILTNGTAAFTVDRQGEERLVVVSEVHRKIWPVSGERFERTTIQHRHPVVFEEILGTVRQAVAAEHDLQLHDLVLIRERTIPKTSSGKIQRDVCKREYEEGRLLVWGDWMSEHQR